MCFRAVLVRLRAGRALGRSCLCRVYWLALAPPTQIKKAGDKDIDDIKTLMEEVDMRIAETKKVSVRGGCLYGCHERVTALLPPHIPWFRVLHSLAG